MMYTKFDILILNEIENINEDNVTAILTAINMRNNFVFPLIIKALYD